ncbi:hypothetical protein [Flexithrix dorotheae]|uniref:hypothetical protein n=1 Tax=Flexithrix dorotheae TaxID=70993 RepID=UPI00035D9646|nr:hypothetical protein [Flexithrix dorotheae]
MDIRLKEGCYSVELIENKHTDIIIAKEAYVNLDHGILTFKLKFNSNEAVLQQHDLARHLKERFTNINSIWIDDDFIKKNLVSFIQNHQSKFYSTQIEIDYKGKFIFDVSLSFDDGIIKIRGLNV